MGETTADDMGKCQMRMDGVGAVPSRAWRSTADPWPRSLLCFFSLICRVMELNFAKDQGLCTTLSYVAFTDIERMIGDAVRFQ